MEDKETMSLSRVENVFAKENIKLIKNSKGINWEIRIVAENNKFTDDDMKRLNDIHEQMTNKYGADDEWT